MKINGDKTTEYSTRQISETRPVSVFFKRLKRETGSDLLILNGRNEGGEGNFKLLWLFYCFSKFITGKIIFTSSSVSSFFQYTIKLTFTPLTV